MSLVGVARFVVIAGVLTGTTVARAERAPMRDLRAAETKTVAADGILAELGAGAIKAPRTILFLLNMQFEPKVKSSVAVREPTWKTWTAVRDAPLVRTSTLFRVTF